MECPECGYARAAYVESRRKFWSGKKGFTEPNKVPRKNFHAKCKKCGWEGEIGNETTNA